MAIPKRIKIERVYVKVASEFDSTAICSQHLSLGRTEGHSLSKLSGTSGRLEPQTTTATETVSLS